MEDKVHPLDRAAQLLNIGLGDLGKMLGVTKSAISQWKLEGRKVPAEHCPEIEKLTHGIVKCEELNSSVDWAFVRRSRCKRVRKN